MAPPPTPGTSASGLTLVPLCFILTSPRGVGTIRPISPNKSEEIMRALVFVTAACLGLLMPSYAFSSLVSPFARPTARDSSAAIREFLGEYKNRGGNTSAWDTIPDSQELEKEAINSITKSGKALTIKKSAWRPVVTLPAIKITGSTRPNAKIDAQVLTAVGGGISRQRLVWDKQKGATGGWRSTFSWSPVTVLVAGSFTDKDALLNVSPAMTFGFFDNLIMLGAGYDLGDVVGRKRLFGLMSIGINFNN